MADHQKTPTVRDWENREFNETVSWNLRKLLDYMNTFGLSLSSLFFSHTDCSAKHITFAHLSCSPFVCAVPPTLRRSLGPLQARTGQREAGGSGATGRVPRELLLHPDHPDTVVTSLFSLFLFFTRSHLSGHRHIPMSSPSLFSPISSSHKANDRLQ